VQIVRRHWFVVGLFALVGMAAGGAYTVYKPPLVSSNALVELSTASVPGMATQVVIASSDDVLAGALHADRTPASILVLRDHIKVNSLTPSVMSFTASEPTARQAEGVANAVAGSYVSYVTAHKSALKLQANLVQTASTATGSSLQTHIAFTAILGAILGLLIGAAGALVFSRSDRRLRRRDEIADAVGVPVLASLSVAHPRKAADWGTLLEKYQPSVAHAWRLQNALQYLGLTEMPTDQARNRGNSVTVLSLASDRGAVALGPQLAVFASSLGISVLLVVGPRQDSGSVATLRAACSTESAVPIGKGPGSLRVAVADDGKFDRRSPAMLTVVVAVVDDRSPRVTETIRSTTTILGVSAGAATAEELARVAASAAADGRHIDGILVADPDVADHTTGRIPQLVRPGWRTQPTRLTGTVTETRP